MGSAARLLLLHVSDPRSLVRRDHTNSTEIHYFPYIHEWQPSWSAAGALAGMTYGMFTVREKFFLDLLSLPDNVSPFAREAHKMYVCSEMLAL